MVNLTLSFTVVTALVLGLKFDLARDEHMFLHADTLQTQHRASTSHDDMPIHRSPSEHLISDSSADHSVDLISIATLLEFPKRYHQKIITVRGTIAQPEMHLDDTQLFFHFVFLLTEGEQSLVVFGRHDRTQGGSAIAMGNTVQVSGLFWKDRQAHDYHFENNLEAITVSPYPSLTPHRT